MWRARATSDRPPLIAVLPFETEGLNADSSFADGLRDQSGRGAITFFGEAQNGGREAGDFLIGRRVVIKEAGNSRGVGGLA